MQPFLVTATSDRVLSIRREAVPGLSSRDRGLGGRAGWLAGLGWAGLGWTGLDWGYYYQN